MNSSYQSYLVACVNLEKQDMAKKDYECLMKRFLTNPPDKLTNGEQQIKQAVRKFKRGS